MRAPQQSRDGARLEAVALDVDGTLVDSERDGHRIAFNRAFEEAGLADLWDVERYGELLAVTGGERRLDGYFKAQGIPVDERQRLASSLHRRKTEIVTEMARQGEIKPRPGVPEFLDELSGAGVRLAVATTGSRRWVDPLLERLFGLERFEVIIGSEEAPERKPDPSVYELALKRLWLSAPAALAVEDSANGLRAAKAAGLACVIVANDYSREQDFGEADLVLDGFGDSEARASVLADPHRVEPPGRLDVDTLRRLVAASLAAR